MLTEIEPGYWLDLSQVCYFNLKGAVNGEESSYGSYLLKSHPRSTFDILKKETAENMQRALKEYHERLFMPIGMK